LISFQLIAAGLIKITPEEGVVDSRPTSSLLECGGFRLVLDTEHPKEDGSAYKAAMRDLNLDPANVECVLFTHLHPDHFGHKDLFPNAAFIYHGDDRFGFYFNKDRRIVLRGSALLELGAGGLDRIAAVEKEPDLRALGDRVYIRHSPGHTPGSTMTFACIGGEVHAWVGDIFLNRDYYEKWIPPGSSWQPERILEHMEYVKRKADVVIPGHGAPFRIRS
jgi:N-acyl homoserine lactone hydrolase